MNITSKKLLKRTMPFDIFSTEHIDSMDVDIETENEITNSNNYIKQAYGGYTKFVTDNISPEELYLRVEISKLEQIKTIKNILCFFVAIIIISAVVNLMIV